MPLISEDEELTAIRGRTAENCLLLDAYRELTEIVEPLGVRPIIIGSAVRGSIKSFVIALSKPLPVDKLPSVLVALAQALRSRGYKVLGEVIEVSGSADDWVIRIPVVMKAGVIADLRVFNELGAENAAEYTTTYTYVSIPRVRRTFGDAVVRTVNINGIVIR